MLLIEQFEKEFSYGSTVRCPACRQGRLFDKATVTKVSAVSVLRTSHEKKNNQIFIKCPKCSRCIGVTFAH